MTCACGHEADVHDGRCYGPYCQCEGFREVVLDPELGHGSSDGEADYYEQVEAFAAATGARVLGDLFPAPRKAKDESALPMAVVYPSRSGRPWAHVVTVVDDPARPYLTCGCRGFAMRGTCWAVARVEALTGVAARKETR